ncbi:MAG: CHAT domain-containing protein [Saprospiraceae bacterium]|nr:CHAT domain-containing protein [Saprospiraceae bacterium]
MKRFAFILSIGFIFSVWQSYTYSDPFGWRQKVVDHFYNAKYDSTLYYITLLSAEYKKNEQAAEEFGLMSFHVRSESSLANAEKARATLEQYKRLYNEFFKGDSVKYAEILDEEGYLAYDINEYNSAIASLEKSLAIKLRHLPPGDSMIAKSYTLLGNVYYYLEENETAFQYHNKSIEIKQKVYGLNHINLAVNFVQRAITRTDHRDSIKSDYYKAIKMATGLSGPSHRVNIACYNNLSSIYYEEGNLDSFLFFLNTAIENNIKLKNERSLAINYTNKARYFQAIGDFEAAMQLTRQAEAIFLKDSERNSPLLANLYDQLGSEYFLLGRLEDAYLNFEKAGALKMKLYGLNSSAVAQYYYNLADINASLLNHEKATELYHKSLQITIDNIGQEDVLVGHIYSEISKIFKVKHEWTEALSNAYKAIKIYSDLYGPHHKFTIESDLDVAEIFYQKGEYNKALKVIQETIAYSFQPSWKYTSLLENPLDFTEMMPFLAGRIMHLKAKILYQKGLEENDPQFFKSAKDALKIGINIQNERYLSFGSLRNQKDLLNEKNKDFALLTDITVSQFRRDKDFKHLSELFSFSEDSKAFNLRDAIRGDQAASFNGVPDSLIDRERHLSQMIHLYLQETQEDESVDWDNKYTVWKQEYDSIRAYIKVQYPEYAAIRYDLSSITLQQTQNLLEESTGIYQILVGGSEYYGLFITRDTAVIKALGPVHMIQGCIEDMHLGMQEVDCKKFTGNSHFLYNLLFQNLETFIPNKIIWVPDLHFHTLNPEILITQKSQEQNKNCLFENQSYLIHSTEIWLSHSITILMGADSPAESERMSNGIAGFAPFTQDSNNNACTNGEGRKMIRLPWAAKALEEMEEVYYGEYLSGMEVEKKKVLNLMKEASILHFGTHAISNKEKPLYSGLVMGCNQNENKSEYDFITAAELYGMRIPAKLTVLTACQTGSGKFESGEGVISLAHAFHYAGCPSTLMTLWSVDDQASSNIALTFYKNLKQGLSFSESLRNAKMEYLDQNKGSVHNPLYWGGLVLIGQNQSWIPESYPFWKTWLPWTLVILILLLLVFFVIKIRGNMTF